MFNLLNLLVDYSSLILCIKIFVYHHLKVTKTICQTLSGIFNYLNGKISSYLKLALLFIVIIEIKICFSVFRINLEFFIFTQN